MLIGYDENVSFLILNSVTDEKISCYSTIKLLLQQHARLQNLSSFVLCKIVKLDKSSEILVVSELIST